MKYLKIPTFIITASLIGALFAGAAQAGPSTSPSGGGTTASPSAQESACLGSGGEWRNEQCTSRDGRTVTGVLQQVINLLIFIVGSIAVIMVVIGSIRYTVAQGDQAAVTSAKNTILYAIIGVVLALSAYGIVNFVTTQIR